MTAPDSLQQSINDLLESFRGLYPKAIDLSLDRVFRFLDQLGGPHRQLPPVFHVAGTNGKGSVCAMLRAMTNAAGLKAHMYTSPHLVHFTERVVVAGREIAPQAFLDILQECRTENGDRPITIFEITTAAALLAFARNPADLCILEVGMGGRLDATNVVDKPAACVINVISYDHVVHLGDDLMKIAAEKAGIMKPNVPCIIGRQMNADIMDVFENKAHEMGAPLWRFGREWVVEPVDSAHFRYADASGEWVLPRPNLPGEHQIYNAGCALAALSAAGMKHDTAGLQAVYWPARMQKLEGALARVVPDGWDLWLDGGHNDTGAIAIAAQMGAWRAENPARPVHLIVGMLSTKRPDDFFAPVLQQADSITLIDIENEPLSAKRDDLAAIAQRHAPAACTVQTAASLRDALTQLPGSGPAGRVLICGSLYLAGRVLKADGSLTDGGTKARVA